MLRLHAPALLLLAWLALLPHSAVAQTPDRAPSARELRDEYPLRPSLQPAAEATIASATPSATAERSGRPVTAQSSRASLQLAIAAVMVMLAFAAGFAVVTRPSRGRSRGEPPPPANRLDTPPATLRAWTAEIEWRPDEVVACFRVIARPAQGGGTSVVAESPPLEWPPTSAESVAALAAAADDLESRLLAAGWRPLAPGDAWYARRFAWEPGAGHRRRRAGSPPDHAEPFSTATGGAR